MSASTQEFDIQTSGLDIPIDKLDLTDQIADFESNELGTEVTDEEDLTQQMSQLHATSTEEIASEAHHFVGVAGTYRDGAFEIREDIHEGEKGDAQWYQDLIHEREDAKSAVELKKEQLRQDIEQGLSKGDLKSGVKEFIKDFHNMRREQVQIRGIAGSDLENKENLDSELEQREQDRDDLSEAHALLDEIMKELELGAYYGPYYMDEEENQQMMVQMILQAISKGDDYYDESTFNLEEANSESNSNP